MATVHAEVETKYDVDDDVAVPGPAQLLRAAQERDAGVTGDGPWAEHGAEHGLAATYYDTPDLRLAAARLTLRRRTGGEDAGWHLKVPMADGSRSEVRLPLAESEADVPEALRRMTHARTGGRELVPVVRLETHRSVREAVDPSGRVLLELADDRVTARRLLPRDGVLPEAVTWREVEVEVVDGPAELLAALDPVLREAGLRPAATASKLVRALGADAVEAARASAGAGHRAGEPGPEASAGDVVLAHVAAQVEQIRAQDLPVRLGVAGSVHAMRVATRRLRSALRTFRPLLQRERTRPVARELRWLAGVLGKARDAEVVRRRVLAAVEDETERSGTLDGRGDVARRLQDDLTTAQDALVAELDGERYRALLDALADLLADPPLRPRAARPATRVLPRLVARADDEVRAAMRAARRTDDPHRREGLLHDARKAAKRARYAAEAAAPVCGEPAVRYAAAMEALQEAVGEHLDSRNTGTRLRDLARHASGPAAAFPLGRLHALEELHAERSLADVAPAWAEAKRKRLRRWLR